MDNLHATNCTCGGNTSTALTARMARKAAGAHQKCRGMTTIHEQKEHLMYREMRHQGSFLVQPLPDSSLGPCAVAAAFG